MKTLAIFVGIAVLLLPLSICQADGYADYVYDANDFAVEVIDYYPVGSAKDWLSGQTFNNPYNALGRPTIDTTGDDWYIPEDQPVPVNPSYPAFRAHELTFLGEKGYLILAFNHPVRDDLNNPYGIDLIVFGNAFQVIASGSGWSNANPDLITMEPAGFTEPGIVSVSQDGQTWYTFTTDPGFMAGNPNFIRLGSHDPDGPFCDAFAPTLGRIYDPNHPDPNLGLWNQWWGKPTNPTFPLDPSLSFASFDGVSLAQLCRFYGYSAGGTGYDIGLFETLPTDPQTGLKWIRYVRIDDKPGGGSAEIDAVSDVSACGDWKHPFPAGDLNRDCKVNLHDLHLLALRWDQSTPLDDLLTVACHWLECTWDCQQ